MILFTIKIEASARRSPMLVALYRRHGSAKTPMKDRRTPRAGARNNQRLYREERY